MSCMNSWQQCWDSGVRQVLVAVSWLALWAGHTELPRAESKIGFKQLCVHPMQCTTRSLSLASNLLWLGRP